MKDKKTRKFDRRYRKRAGKKKRKQLIEQEEGQQCLDQWGDQGE